MRAQEGTGLIRFRYVEIDYYKESSYFGVSLLSLAMENIRFNGRHSCGFFRNYSALWLEPMLTVSEIHYILESCRLAREYFASLGR